MTLSPRLLTPEEYRATFGPSMRNTTSQEPVVSPEGVIDVEPYFHAIPRQDLRGHQVPRFCVEYTARGSDGRYDHVVIPTTTRNIFVVVVVSLLDNAIYGHHLLDLNELYSLKTHELG